MEIDIIGEEDRLLIIHADDFGMCHATNQAIIQLLDEGAISSTTLMVNCPCILRRQGSCKQSKV